MLCAPRPPPTRPPLPARRFQARDLKTAGLTAYNHNLDTSREHYPNVITTRSYDDRLQTIANVRKAGISVCCGGILGLGESEDDRIGCAKASGAAGGCAALYRVWKHVPLRVVACERPAFTIGPTEPPSRRPGCCTSSPRCLSTQSRSRSMRSSRSRERP